VDLPERLMSDRLFLSAPSSIVFPSRSLTPRVLGGADARRVCATVDRKGRYNPGETLNRTATQGGGTSRRDVFLRDSQAPRRGQRDNS
jgi:hypothetical protein